jgi:TRAP transporter 4TM/12TM fusion protein
MTAQREDQTGGVERKLEELRDIEVATGRELEGALGWLFGAVAVAMSLFHIYVLIFRAIDPWYFRSLHVVFAGVLVFAWFPGWRRAPRRAIHWADGLLMAAIIAPVAYLVVEFDTWIYRVGVTPNAWDVFFSLLFVLAVVEMTRRAAGWPLTILAVLFIIYGHLGPYMPGLFHHRGYSWPRLITYLFSLEGILSTPVSASATYVFLFVLFGAFVERTGTGKFFVDFALSLAGRYRGGPAKVSIVSSALFGTASGSSVANVVVDGVFNIPLMKANGFKKHIAGAIEAMNSTGGQIMPPVMGAGAFLMAEILGVSYGKVAVAAIIPALLYYTAAYWMIDLEAARSGIRGLPREAVPRMARLLRTHGYLLLPLAVLFYFLMWENLSPFRSAMYAILTAVAVSWFRADTWLGFRGSVASLADGGKRSIEIASTCAAAGIIVGVLSLTGLGVKFAFVIITYSGGSLLLALIFSMLVALVLGMGMPTTAAYAIAASVLAPALSQLGIPPLAAHLFIFYFACISALTPPVALASYAAAAIAEAPMWSVGLHSVRLSIAGYIIPYMFVYGPALILQGSWLEIIWAATTAVVGTLALAAAVQGWGVVRAGWIQRGLLFVAALSLIKPGVYTDLLGFALLVVVGGMQMVGRRRAPGGVRAGPVAAPERQSATGWRTAGSGMVEASSGASVEGKAASAGDAVRIPGA